MKKRLIVMLTLFAIVVGVCNAERKPAFDLGDVRIYSLGDGSFEVESDRVQQCFVLSFQELGPGLIEVACSSYVRKVTAGGIGEAVKWVVTGYLGGSKLAGSVAGTLASWATKQGIDYLCNSYGY